jgi:hypothetical protein
MLPMFCRIPLSSYASGALPADKAYGALLVCASKAMGHVPAASIGSLKQKLRGMTGRINPKWSTGVIKVYGNLAPEER